MIQGENAHTVSLMPIDSFGAPLQRCQLTSFIGDRDEGRPERKDLFDGLVARDVPYGEYLAFIRCGGDTGAVGFVQVHDSEVFWVLSSPRHFADYVPGKAPVFIVDVQTPRSTAPDSMWVELSGVYMNERLRDRVDPGTRSAHFTNPGIGAYFLTVASGGRILCHGEVTITDPKGALTVRTGRTCSVESRGASLIPAAPRLK
ncbi:MAG: hypothetical protein ABSF98_27410 [Bryobacteraceae bacterium]